MPSVALQVLPIGFMGNPLNIWPRSHSLKAHDTLNIINRDKPVLRDTKTNKATRAGKIANPAHSATIAGKASQANLLVSNNMAEPTQ